ncbi:hypothetical protein HYE82_08695 [Streptomyces sp. BR123]|uniref:hypothetical protein n=1 Tax=Streptomyces sp. BR123 TaxID=2749828 RepID=UPI0015C46B55|nr:hypothetical protein [Streptomyces sp. BR123]NXY94468.1 hypothetical protein [Streptomyces sp. BR123]
MTTRPKKPTDHQDSSTSREESSSAPTWEYGAPDLGLGPAPRTKLSADSDDVVRDGVEG